MVIETSLLETAYLRPEILDTKKVEKELTRFLFDVMAGVIVKLFIVRDVRFCKIVTL